MILFGDPNIITNNFIKISSLNDIKNISSNSIVSFKYDLEFMQYCHSNSIKFAVFIENIAEAVYANILEASYIIVEKLQAKKIQEIADNYMYDSKILVQIHSPDEIEWVALNSIDGAVYI